MKKMFLITLILVLALILGMTIAQADPEDLQGQILPDFTVNTIDGGTFSLSQSLQTHDLVLINFWATWCGPCCMEFPYLEAAWEQYSGRVDVIAMSIEGADTFDVLRSFAGDYGLHFPIGRDESGMFDSMNGSAIPTTLIVDRNRCVVAVEIGCKTSTEEFTNLFDSLLPAEAARGLTCNRCELRFVDMYGNAVPGVTIAFCNGEYTPVETDFNGCVTFDGDLRDYHVHLLAVPDGYRQPWEELHIVGDEYNLIVVLPSLRHI